jgi:hypothetical protein
MPQKARKPYEMEARLTRKDRDRVIEEAQDFLDRAKVSNLPQARKRLWQARSKIAYILRDFKARNVGGKS